jgi:release factor glutamine methyltransferase
MAATHDLASGLERALAAGGVVALRHDVARRLAAAGVASPAVDARWLVESATLESGPLGAARGPGEPAVDVASLAGRVARRIAREPLQVVLGTVGFRHVTLRAASGVFVPRPETEVVAGLAVDAARAVRARPARVVDACTGSGAIALAVASEVPRARVVATEVDPAAVAVARANLADLTARTPPPDVPWRPGDRLAPGADVRIVAGDLLDEVDPGWRGTVDVLVANPPYLPAADRGTWAPEVADHDPDRALVGGRDGHEVVDRLLRLAGEWLRPGGTVVVEIDDRRGQDALAAATAAGLVGCRVVADLAGRDRAIAAARPDVRPPPGGRPARARGTMSGPAPDRTPRTQP